MVKYLLVFSLWGNTGTDWVYIGNQYVLNQPMPLEQCEAMANLDNWSWHESNQYYSIQLSCHKEGTDLK